jgi:hypothetical protein
MILYLFYPGGNPVCYYIPFSNNNHDHRRFGSETVQFDESAKGRAAQSVLNFLIVHYDKLPRLDVAGGRSKPGGIDTAQDIFMRHSSPAVSAHAASFLNKFLETALVIHYSVHPFSYKLQILL